MTKNKSEEKVKKDKEIVWLSEEVKDTLYNIKERKESFEDVILRLIKEFEEYKKVKEENLRLIKENKEYEKIVLNIGDEE